MRAALRIAGMLLMLVAASSALAARPAHLLESFAKTQLIIDTSGSGCVLFDVYVAQTDAQRSQGLMYIETMGEFEGMIFLYERPMGISMWMKNTLIALDMLFLGSDSTIAAIHQGAVPLSEEIISPGINAAGVIELNAGAVQRFNIAVGNRIYLQGN